MVMKWVAPVKTSGKSRSATIQPLTAMKARELARKLEELANCTTDLKTRARRKVLARNVRVVAKLRAYYESRAASVVRARSDEIKRCP